MASRSQSTIIRRGFLWSLVATPFAYILAACGLRLANNSTLVTPSPLITSQPQTRASTLPTLNASPLPTAPEPSAQPAPTQVISTDITHWSGMMHYDDESRTVVFALQFAGEVVTGRMQVVDPENGTLIDFGPVSGSLSGTTGTIITVITLGGATLEGNIVDEHIVGTISFPPINGDPELTAGIELVRQ